LAQVAVTTEDKLWTRSYISLLLINLLLCFGFYMLPPTLPAYVKQIGGSNLQASLVFGTFSSMSLIARIVSGSLVDVRGEKTIMLIGMVIVVACSITYIWLPVNGILLLRTLQGLGWGMSTAAIATAVYKIVPDKRRGEGSGYYVLTTIISLSLTPVAAIMIMNSFNFIFVMLVSGALTIAGILMLAGGLSNPSPVSKTANGQFAGISMKNVFEKGALLPSALCFLLSIPLCGIMGYLVLFAKELELENVWIYFIGYTLMILVTRPFIGKLFDQKGHAVIILPGSLLMILGLIALSFTQSTAMLVISSLLYGLGYGAVQPSLQTWAVNRCPPDRKGAANGLFLSAIDLGYMIGSVILGYTAGLTNYASMYGYSTIFMFLFVVIYGLALLTSRAKINHLA
jgi:MFS family permease